MNKKVALIVLVALLAVSAVFAEYDKNTTVQVMRNNATLMGQIGQAATARDYYQAAAAMVKMADGMNKLLAFTPPKGSKEQWDSTLKQFLDAVYRGIGSCAEKNPQKLDAAVAEVRAQMQRGHSLFR